MMYKIVIAIALAASTSAKLFPEDPSQQKALWEGYKLGYGKRYDTMEEESRRFAIFIENLKLADHRNMQEAKAGGKGVHGITKFSDLSQAEFEAKFLTADVSKKVKGSTSKVSGKVNSAAGLVDWTGVYTTPVKDQGYCGSCWAFSATEQIESDSMRTLGTSYILSPEQITQCATDAFGCFGGWTEVAYGYVKSAGGIVQESDYPYTSYWGKTGDCKVNLRDAVITLVAFTSIDGTTPEIVETNMASYVQETGPLSVCVDAKVWNTYHGGILSTCGYQVDHCVQAVGVDASTVNGYWKVRNSWGVGWGESGFIRLAYGQNTCAIASDPTWTMTGKVT